MLVRIQGKITAVNMVDGTSKTTGRPWSKKVYVVSDDFARAEYNRSVHVEDFGKLDPDSMQPQFLYKSNFLEGETVDIACFLETNEYGFTKVAYYKPYEDTTKPADKPAEPEQESAQEVVEQAPMPAAENSVLPF